MDYNKTCSSSSGASVTPKNKEKKKKKSQGATVRLSTDPQSVAARERRHRISDRFKMLQSMVPGGTKMDTVSMLEEAIHYVKFLKTQIWLHQTIMNGGGSSLVDSTFSLDDIDEQDLSFLYHHFPQHQLISPSTSVVHEDPVLPQTLSPYYANEFNGDVNPKMFPYNHYQ